MTAKARAVAAREDTPGGVAAGAAFGSIHPVLVPAVVAYLAADATIAGLVGLGVVGTPKVYTNVPQDETHPYIEVLGGEEVPWAIALDRTQGIDAELLVRMWSAHRGTGEVDGLAGAVLLALRDVVFPLPPWPTVMPVKWLANQRPNWEPEPKSGAGPARQRTMVFRVRAR